MNIISTREQGGKIECDSDSKANNGLVQPRPNNGLVPRRKIQRRLWYFYGWPVLEFASVNLRRNEIFQGGRSAIKNSFIGSSTLA